MDPRFNSWHAWFETEVSAGECRQAQHHGVGWEWSAPQTTVKNNYDSVRCRALRWAGRKMVRWGSRLQERYSATGKIPALHPANSTR
jgi:hypothetical protein